MRWRYLVSVLICACDTPQPVAPDAVSDAVPDASSLLDADDGLSCLSGTPQIDPGLVDAEVVISHLHNIYALGFNASSIYVLTWDGLFRADRDPCALHLLIPQPVYRFAVDDASVYWMDVSNRLVAMPAVGGAESILYTPGGFDALALGSDAVFVSAANLVRVPKDGSAPVTLDGPSVHSSGLAATDSDLYYFYQDATVSHEDLVHNDAVTGGARQIVVPHAAELMDTVTTIVDATHVYWMTSTELRRATRASPVSVEPVAQLPSSPETPIAQDTSYVYYGRNTYTTGAWQGEIVRVAKQGLTADVIASANGAFRALAVDGPFLYFGVGFEGNFEERKEWVGRLQR